MKRTKKHTPIHLTIDEKAYKEHCQEVEKFAKALMWSPFMKDLIADKEAGN